MRRWIPSTPALCLFGAAVLLAGPTRGAAQEGQGKYITEATVRLTRLIGSANKDGYELPNDTLAVGGGWLTKNTKTWVRLGTVKLEEGKAYRFLAAGDSDARDVDVEIRNSDGKVVAGDVKTDSEAIVDYTASASGTYEIRVRLYDSMNDLPCFCVALMLVKKK